jgi:hypothetical protein
MPILELLALTRVVILSHSTSDTDPKVRVIRQFGIRHWGWGHGCLDSSLQPKHGTRHWRIPNGFVNVWQSEVLE